MTEVLYRKWRPRRLDQLVGQETVSQTLRQAVSLNRLAHAYLFCGPRGTGKTSTARILAMAANCRAPENGEPDNKCDICVSIREGHALDLIEIDAASNRGIDDIRDLSDKVRFTPAQATYKVYIIDEVHMLTAPAFNALLKTLEEPPGHAIFILATTEVHRLPLTVISRCQRFDFHRIPQGLIEAKLAELCREEDVEASAEALALIARNSSGSLRDAENLLEQVVVSYGSPLTEAHVRDMLGLTGDEVALQVAGHVLKGNIGGGLGLIGQVTSQGSDLAQLQRGVVDVLRGVLLLKTGGGRPEGYPEEATAQMKELADSAQLDRLVHALKTFSNVDMRRDSYSPLPLELALLDSSSGPQPPAAPPVRTQEPQPRAAAPQSSQPVSRASRPRPQYESARQGRPAAVSAPPPAPARQAEPRPAAGSGGPDGQWNEIVRALRLTGTRFKLGALLRGCKEREIADGVVRLRFSWKSHVDRLQEELGNPVTRREVEQALERVLGEPYRLEASVSATDNHSTQRSISDRSPLVRTARSKGAQVVGEREEEG